MMTDKEFDKILKQKLQAPLTQFDPIAWEKMNEMLDADAARKAKQVKWRAGAVALLMVLSGMVSWLILSSNNSEEEKDTMAEVAIVEPKSTQTNAATNKNLSASPNANAELNSARPSHSDNRAAQRATNATPIAQGNQGFDNQRAASPKAPNSGNTRQTVPQNSNPDPEPIEASRVSNAAHSVGGQNVANQNTKATATTENQQTTAPGIGQAYNNRQPLTRSTSQNNQFAPSTKKHFFDSLNRQNSANAPQGANFADSLFPLATTSIANLPLLNTIAPQLVAPDLRPSTPPELSKMANKKFVSDKPFRYTANIGLLAGISTCNNLGGKSGFSFQPQDFNIGLFYKLQFKPKWAIEANLIYLSRAAKAGAHHYQYRKYGFGLEQTDVVLEPLRLYYIETPIVVSYQVHRKVNVGLGGYYARLLDGQSRVSEQFKTTTGAFSSNQVVEQGYILGFNRNDYGILAAVNYQLVPHISAELRTVYGFTDITQNNYFANNVTDQNISFRFLLKYEIK